MKTGLPLPLVYIITLAALMIAAGCEDPGSYGEGEAIVYGHVSVYSSNQAPPMDDPLNDIWNDPVTSGIIVSDSAFTDDTLPDGSPNIDSLTVLMEAIRSGDYLYIRARWADTRTESRRSYSVWQRPAVHQLTLTQNIDTTVVPPDTTLDTLVDAWYRRSFTVILEDTTWLEQDRFAFMWDAGVNPGQQADCRSMCHGDSMYTDGGFVDVWHWQAATTDPALLAQDEYWGPDGPAPDAFTREIFSSNYDTLTLRPIFMHQNTDSLLKPFLHADQTVPFDSTRTWANGDKIPAHFVNNDAAGSVADVDAFSSFNRMNGWWTLLMRRSLTTSTGITDDIDFSAIAPGDSVMVTVAQMDHTKTRHYASRPIYFIF